MPSSVCCEVACVSVSVERRALDMADEQLELKRDRVTDGLEAL